MIAEDDNYYFEEFDESKFQAPIFNDKQKSIIVGIIGLPNAGKSSLMNRIVGEKVAGVSPRVQTTRNTIRGIKMHGDIQIIFTDSPGVIDPKNAMDNFMTVGTKSAIKDSDMLLVMLDIKAMENPKFSLIIDHVQKYGKKEKILVVNKIDSLKGDEFDQKRSIIEEKYAELFERIFYISVTENLFINGLLDFIAMRAQTPGWLYDPEAISTYSMKFCAAEITREKIFNLLHMELPYSVVVETDQFNETDTGIQIAQTIYVSRQAHKSMVIGAKASMLKKIGIASRIELEQMLGKKINLLLYVKVKEDWMKNENFIKSTIGYAGS